MTDREREFLRLGLNYAEGIERAERVYLPDGRHVDRWGERWYYVDPNRKRRSSKDLLRLVKLLVQEQSVES